MTKLSVNLNKIALLRNSRGRDYPNVVDYAKRFIDLGVQGITIHPRQDERHAKRKDARDLGLLLGDYPDVELNIEGFPSYDFLELIEEVKPDQCTLVPDDVNQITSDHGWDIDVSAEILAPSLERIHRVGTRSSLFLDPDSEQVRAAARIGTARIELYTEQFAQNYARGDYAKVLTGYREAMKLATSLGLGVNAGHDLDLKNLSAFLEIGGVLEVSIGHALTIECIDQGMESVVAQYLSICNSSAEQD